MITQILNEATIQHFRGLSSDTKPTDCVNGSDFIEIDTGDVYMFDGVSGSWIKVRGSAAAS